MGRIMKIKTKRGARRIRDQRVIDRRFVVTDYDGRSHITAGKLYRVIDINEGVIDYGHKLTLSVMIGEWSHLPDHVLNGIGTWYHPIR